MYGNVKYFLPNYAHVSHVKLLFEPENCNSCLQKYPHANLIVFSIFASLSIFFRHQTTIWNFLADDAFAYFFTSLRKFIRSLSPYRFLWQKRIWNRKRAFDNENFNVTVFKFISSLLEAASSKNKIKFIFSWLNDWRYVTLESERTAQCSNIADGWCPEAKRENWKFFLA